MLSCDMCVIDLRSVVFSSGLPTPAVPEVLDRVRIGVQPGDAGEPTGTRPADGVVGHEAVLEQGHEDEDLEGRAARATHAARGDVELAAVGVGPDDRKSVVYGKSVSVRVDSGGRRIIKK